MLALIKLINQVREVHQPVIRPVHRNIEKQKAFDLVLLDSPRQEAENGHRQPRLIDKPRDLPSAACRDDHNRRLNQQRSVMITRSGRHFTP